MVGVRGEAMGSGRNEPPIGQFQGTQVQFHVVAKADDGGVAQFALHGGVATLPGFDPGCALNELIIHENFGQFLPLRFGEAGHAGRDLSPHGHDLRRPGGFDAIGHLPVLDPIGREGIRQIAGPQTVGLHLLGPERENVMLLHHLPHGGFALRAGGLPDPGEKLFAHPRGDGGGGDIAGGMRLGRGDAGRAGLIGPALRSGARGWSPSWGSCMWRCRLSMRTLSIMELMKALLPKPLNVSSARAGAAVMLVASNSVMPVARKRRPRLMQSPVDFAEKQIPGNRESCMPVRRADHPAASTVRRGGNLSLTAFPKVHGWSGVAIRRRLRPQRGFPCCYAFLAGGVEGFPFP